jgi:hypothetical protein
VPTNRRLLRQFKRLRLGRVHVAQALDAEFVPQHPTARSGSNSASAPDGFVFGHRRLATAARHEAARVCRSDLPGLQVLNERIEAGILRNDVEERPLVVRCKPAEVVRDMEVEGIGARRFQFDGISPLAQLVDRQYKVTWKLRVVGAEEDAYLELLVFQHSERLHLHALVVDQHVVRASATAPALPRAAPVPAR